MSPYPDGTTVKIGNDLFTPAARDLFGYVLAPASGRGACVYVTTAEMTALVERGAVVPPPRPAEAPGVSSNDRPRELRPSDLNAAIARSRYCNAVLDAREQCGAYPTGQLARAIVAETHQALRVSAPRPGPDRPPGSSTVRDWVGRYERAGFDIRSLIDRRSRAAR